MAQTIKLKRSGTQGAAPSTSNLELGEVAINTYDGKMYIKKSVNGTESIVEVGGGGSVSYLEAGMIEYEYTATSNQTTFSGSDSNSATLSYTANSIMVFLNGVLQDDGVDYTATNGTSVVFTSALTANDEVRIVAFTNVTTAGTLQNPTKLDAITTVNSQAAYSLTVNSSAYTPSSQNALIVSLNGITQEPGDSFTISGSTITFSPALVTGDVVDYIVDMGRAVTIGQYDSDLLVSGELEVTGDIVGDLRGATLFKGQAGEALSKGDVVYISGISGNTTVVSKADADDAAKMPAFGVVAAAANINTSVNIYTFGELSGLDTSSYSEGDELFVSTTAGALTNSAPTGESSKLQKIAKVTRSDNSAGSIFIMGAGRSNAVPNLDDGDIFIGNASNQAVSASLNTKIEEYLDAGTSTPTFSTLAAGNITTTGYIAGPSTFTIDPAAVGDNTGTLVVAGNLQVDGTTTTINSTTMTVDDLNITLASGAANAAAANGAGITVDGASATLTYNSTPDAWSFNKNVAIGATSIINPNSYGAVLNIEGYAPALVLSEDTGRDYTIGVNGNKLNIINETTNVLTIADSGNVGIGTTSPDSILHLSDSSSSKIIIEDSANPRGNYIGINSSDNLVIAADEDNLGSSSTIQFRVDATERMRINSSGNVGIGTPSPADELEIEGTDPAIRWDDTSAGGYARLEATNGSMVYESDQGNTVGNSTHIFKVDGTERMRINSSGNVGIGETNPTTGKLVVKNTDNDDYAIRIGNIAGASGSLVGITKIGLDTGTSSPTHPSAAIEVEQAAISGYQADLVFSTRKSNSDVAPTESLRIDSEGKVSNGTGTTKNYTYFPLPYFYMGASSITDEYLIISRYNDTGSAVVATGVDGEILFSRGNTGAGNAQEKVEISVQDAWTGTPRVIRFNTSDVRRFFRIDVITVDSQKYLALRAAQSGGGSTNHIFFRGIVTGESTDSKLLTRVRESDSNVTVNTSGWMYPAGFEYRDDTTGGFLGIRAGGADVGQFKSTGLHLVNGKGIDFGASSGSGSTSTLLDDYEEGNWTPAISSGATVNSYTTQSGVYVKIGRLVHIRFYIQGNITATNQTLFLSGLPFNYPSSTLGWSWLASGQFGGNMVSSADGIVIQATNNLIRSTNLRTSVNGGTSATVEGVATYYTNA